MVIFYIPNNNMVDSLIGWTLSHNFQGLKIQQPGSFFYPNGSYPFFENNNQSLAWQHYQNTNSETRSIRQNIF